MKNFLPCVKKTASLLILMLFIASATMAQITATPASGGSNISADKAANATLTTPAFTTLGDIVINETAAGDFDPSTTSIILNAPAGWTFNTSGVTANVNAGSDVTINNISYTSTQITLSVTIGNLASNLDAITISGVQVMSTDGSVLPNSGNITVTTDGTTSVTPGTNLGSLSQITGAASQIAISAGNSQTAVAGAAVGTSPAVLVTDQFNNPVSGVSVTFTASGDGSVTGGPFLTNVSGIATVGSWILATTAGSNTLTANAGSLTTSFSATGIAGAATHLVFTVQPVSATAGATIGSVSVTAEDVNNNIVTSYNGDITISINNNPSTGTLSGTLTVTAVGGVASFNDLSIDNPGTGYTLKVTDGTLVSNPLESSPFDILAGPALSADALADFGTQCINGTYGPNSFTITGTNLTNANVLVQSLSGFTFSTTSNGTYTSSLNLTQSGGSYSQTIFVKFSPSASSVYDGNIVISGGGASSINVAATGSGSPVPTLGGVTQSAAVCDGTNAAINLTGLLVSTQQTISYNINGGSNLTATVTSDASGNASFTTNLVFANNGQTLTVTHIDIIGGTACGSDISNTNTASLTVNAIPTVAAIGDGQAAVCVGSQTAAFTDATSGGSWSIINGTGTATIDNSGVVTGATAGTVTVVYTVTSSGCTATATTGLTVNDLPVVAAVGGGQAAVCIGSQTVAFTDATGGGSWSIINGTGTATIDNSGVVTGVAAGTVTVVYTVTSSGCTATATTSLTVNDLPAVAAIGDGALSVCVGAQTPAFTDATAGGTWSITSGTGTASITTGGVVTGLTAGSVTVVYTFSDGTCSNSVSTSLTINDVPVVAAVGGGQAEVCVGSQTVAFTDATGGGSWSIINGTGTATIDNSGVATGVTAGTVTVVYTVTTNGCTATATTSLTVNDLPTISNVTGTTSICSGNNTVLTANSSASSPSFNWYSDALGTSLLFTGSAFTTPALSVGTDYYVSVTDGVSGCTSALTKVSVTVNASTIIATGPSTPSPVCANATAPVLSVSASGAGTLTYQWYNNGTNNSNTGGTSVGNANGGQTANYTPDVSASGTTYYYVIVTGTCGAATSDAVAVVVNPSLPASVSISSDAPLNTICAGTSVTFTASATNGGSAPVYQWKVNGVNAGTNSPTFTTTTLANNDAVTVTLTSNASPCLTNSPVTSTAITTTVNPLIPASVSISASPSNSICIGTNVTFTATPINGGGTPSYQWKVNGSNVGTNSPTFSSTTLANNDAVTVVMTSSSAGPCLTNSPATSNAITMTVAALPTITGTLSACVGGTSTLTGGGAYLWSSDNTGVATVTNGASSPVTVGPNFAGAGATDGGSGTGWSNPGRVTADDNSYATVSGTGTAFSEGLQATNFGFTSANIPANATITGITVTIGRFSSSTGIRDNSVTLLGGSVAGSNFAKTTTDWPTSEGPTSYSSVTDPLWGNTWTRAQIISSGFGVSLKVSNTSTFTSRTADVDYIQVSVTYTTPAAGTTTTVTAVSAGTAHITYTNSSGCQSQSTFTVNPLPTATISGTTSVCQNGVSPNVTFTGANGTAPYTFTYKINTGSNLTVTTTSGNSVTVAAPTGTAGTFAYTLVSVQDASSTSCSQAQTGTATITVNALPTPTFTTSPTSPICAGASATYTTQSGQSNYTWSVSGVSGTDYTITSGGIGATNNTVTLKWLTAGSKTVTVNYSTSGCMGVTAASSTITVNAVPAVPTISGGSSNVCAGSQTPAFIGAPTGGTWSLVGSGATINASTGVVTATTAGTVTVVYTVSNASGCTNSASQSLTINALPVPVITKSPNSTAICVNATMTYTTATGQSNYVWAFPGTTSGTDYTITSGGTSADNSVTVQWLTAGTNNRSVSVVYTNSNGCTASSATTSTITVNALPTPTFTVSPTSPICAGASATYTTQTGQSNYAWSVPGTLGTDYTITSGGIGTTSSTVTLKWITSGSKTVTVNYRNGNGCTGATAASSTVTVNPLSDATISGGAATVCVSSQTPAFTGATPGGTWSSSSSSVATIDPTTGIATGVATGTTTITYTVTNGNGCTNTATTSLTVNGTPTPIVITPSAPFICNGDNVQLIATGGGGVTPVKLFYDSFENSGSAYRYMSNTVSVGAAYSNLTYPNTSGWTASTSNTKTSGNNDWTISYDVSGGCSLEGQHSLEVFRQTGSYCSYANNNNNIYVYSSFSSDGYSNLSLTFKYKVGGDGTTPGTGSDYGTVIFSTNGINWTDLPTHYSMQATAAGVTVSLPDSISNKPTVYFGYRWTTNSSGGSGNGLIIDDVVITGTNITSPSIAWTPTTNLSISATGDTVVASPATTTTYTATSTTAGGCSSSQNVTVTVNPAIPTIGAQAVTICGGSGDVSFVPAGMPSGYNTTTGVATGVTYTWGTPTYNSVTGSYNASYNTTQQSAVIDHLTNTTNSPQTAVYNVNPSFNGSCASPATTFVLTVTVYPAIPTLTPQTATICTNQAFTYAPVGMPTGITYAWSVQSSDPTISGAVPGSGSAQVNGGTLVNSGSTTASVTYSVTPSFSGNCQGTPFTVTVSVNPTAASTFSYSNSSYCATGTVTANFTGTTGGTFSYVNSSNVASGLGLNSSDGSIDMSASTAGTYTVTYTIPASGGCSAYSPPSVQVTVLALPALQSFNIAGSDVYYCTPGPGYDIKLQGSETGVSYQLMYDNGLGGGPVAVGAAKPGTGAALDFGFKTPLGAYTVVGTNSTTGCTRTVSAQELDLHSAPAPHIYNLTVNGASGVVNATVCAGSQPNNANSLILGVSNSDNFANYTLFMDDGNGNVTQVDAQVGTGSAITFIPISTAGLYYIYASSNCGQQLMSGQVQITVNPLPASPSLNVTQPSCAVATATITVLSPETTLYSLDGAAPVAQTSFTVPAGTTHTVAAFNGTCYGPVTSVTVNAQPATPATPTVSVTQPTCTLPQTGTIMVTAPTGLGYSYSIDGLDYSNTNGTFTGLTPGVTYSVTASNGTCISQITSVTISQVATTPGDPTALILTPGSATISGSFTAPAPPSTNYLVIRTLTSTAPSAPVDGTIYTAGTAALGGFIAAVTTTTSFTDNAVVPGVTYWYWVYAYNAQTCARYSTGNISGSAVANSCSSTTILYWAGAGTTVPSANSDITTNLQFNNPINWSISNSAYNVSSTAPTACTDIVMNLSTSVDQTISLSTAVVANSLTMNLFGTAKNTVDVGPYVFRLLDKNATGALAISAGISGSSKAYLTTEGGVINISGTSIIGAATDAGYSYIGNGDGVTSGGSITFKGDVTFNSHSAISNGAFVSAVFDGTGAQSLTNNTNSADANVGANAISFHDIKIGNTNTPAVTLAGSSSGIDYVNGGNLTISANSSLTMPSGYGINQLSASAGTMTLGSGATLHVGGGAAGTNSIAGSNFPGGFASYTFDCASTTEYYGTTQTVFSGSSYGNLTITTAGVKTAGGNLNICSNVLINPNATFAGSTFSHTVGGNWTNKGAFTPNSSTVAFNGSNSLQQTIGGPISTTFSSLTINNSAGVTIIDPANTGISKNVNAVLTLTSGLLTTDANNLLILGSAASTNLGAPDVSSNYYQNTSYVNGPLQKIGSTGFTFPIGKSGTGYEPITISAASDNSSQTYTAEYIRAAATSLGPVGPSTPQLVHVSGCDYWRLDNGSAYPSNTNNTLANGATANLTMYWSPNNGAGCTNNYVTNLSTLAIGHLDYVTGQSYAGLWDPIGVGAYNRTGSATSGSIGYVGVSTFSPFSLATLDGTDNPLPIKLEYFTATKANGYNKLTWKAECTSSSAGFEVERSNDGVSFTGIHYVAVNNATDCAVPFIYDDYTSSGSKVYYRIKMIDINGNVSYSEIKLILNDANTIELMNIRPNPLQSEGWLQISASQSNKIELVVLTIDGREMLRKTVLLQPGSNTVNMETASLAKGMYIVRGIFSGGQTNVVPFIKQ